MPDNSKEMDKPEVIYTCKDCGATVSENDKFCSKCNKDLSKVGRNISLTISDYIRLSEDVRLKIVPADLKWDPQSLTFLGVIITVFLGVSSLLFSSWKSSLILTILVSILITLISLLIVTKVKRIKNLLVKYIIWFLK